MPTKIYSPVRNKPTAVASARIDSALYVSMVRCAELNGYEYVSAFVKDAILDKMQSTASAMVAICKDSRVKA